MSENQIFSIIKSIAWQLFPNCKVILFGSRARQDNMHDSDYDILLIIDQTLKPEDKLPYCTQIRKYLLNYGVFSDILIQSDKEIEIKKQLTGHIIKTIMNEGKAI